MRNLCRLLIVFCVTLKSFAQKDTVFLTYNLDDADKVHYKTDTVYFETPMRRHILMGTTVLPSTQSQQTAKSMGLYLQKVTQSDCQKDMTAEKYTPDRVASVINTATGLVIDITISDNCCYSFLCDIEIVNDSILNLVYHGYGTYCDCDCCFGLTYQFIKEDSPDLQKIKSVMINGNMKSLKKLDTERK